MRPSSTRWLPLVLVSAATGCSLLFNPGPERERIRAAADAGALDGGEDAGESCQPLSRLLSDCVPGRLRACAVAPGPATSIGSAELQAILQVGTEVGIHVIGAAGLADPVRRMTDLAALSGPDGATRLDVHAMGLDPVNGELLLTFIEPMRTSTPVGAFAVDLDAAGGLALMDPHPWGLPAGLRPLWISGRDTRLAVGGLDAASVATVWTCRGLDACSPTETPGGGAGAVGGESAFIAAVAGDAWDFRSPASGTLTGRTVDDRMRGSGGPLVATYPSRPGASAIVSVDRTSTPRVVASAIADGSRVAAEGTTGIVATLGPAVAGVRTLYVTDVTCGLDGCGCGAACTSLGPEEASFDFGADDVLDWQLEVRGGLRVAVFLVGGAAPGTEVHVAAWRPDGASGAQTPTLLRVSSGRQSDVTATGRGVELAVRQVGSSLDVLTSVLADVVVDGMVRPRVVLGGMRMCAGP